MSLIAEFKKFAMRGNVVDLAVGVIIGASFTGIVTSLVNDVIMPPIGMLIGNVDFSSLGIVLKAAEGTVPAVILKYGVFVNAIIDFVIVAFAIFLLIRALNSLQKKQEVAPAAPAPPPKQEVLLEEIRDLLKAGKR